MASDNLRPPAVNEQPSGATGMTDAFPTHDSKESSLAKHPAEDADTPAGSVDDAVFDREKQIDGEVNPNNVASTASQGGYPKAGKLIFILLALALSVFLVSLDMTIIATAIPRITDQFHSLDDVGWYGTAFFLTLARQVLSLSRISLLLTDSV